MSRPTRSHPPEDRDTATATPNGTDPERRDTERQEPGRQEPERQEPERSESRLLSDSGSMATATLISRVTGFLKIAGLSYVLGLATANNSFSIANTLPTIVAELVLGAVLASIVVPTLVRAEREDADGGALFTRKLLTLSTAVLAVATLASMVFAPLLTDLYLGSDTKANASLTTTWALLLLPQILFYGLSALFGAILNTHGVFGRVAWAPVLNNVVSILVLGAYYLTPGSLAIDPVSITNPKLLVLGIGTTLGIVVQAAYLVPALRRAGVDLRPKWGFDPRLAQFGGMAVAVIGYVLVSQVGLTVTTRVANDADSSGFVLYNLAWVLLQVPYGIIVVSLLTAIMPRLSRSAASADHIAVVDDLSLGSRLCTVALVPIITLFSLRGVLVAVALLSYGASTTENASRLGSTFAVSAFGLLPYALVMLQLRVFYARNQAWAPTVLMLLMMAVKIPLSIWRPPGLADTQVVEWLAFVNSGTFVVGAVVGGIWLRSQLGPLHLGRLLRTAGLVAAATVVGAAVDALVTALVLNRVFPGALTGLDAFVQFTVHSVVVLGIAFGLLVRFRLAELAGVTAAIGPRLRRLARRPDRTPGSGASGAPDSTVSGGDPAATTRIASAAATPGVGHAAPPATPVDAGGTHAFDPSEPREDQVPALAFSDAPTTVLDVAALGSLLPSATAVDARVDGVLPYPGRLRHAPGAATTRGGQMDVENDSATPSSTPADVAGGSDARSGAEHRAPAERVPEQRSAEQGTPEHRAPDQGGPRGSHPAQHQPAGGGRRRVRGPRLVPGAAVAGGRYRLIAAHGGHDGLLFWQGRDTMLDRDVALTFVDAEQRSPEPAGHVDERPDPADEGPQAVLSRTLRLGRVDAPGLARVLDVVRGSSGGIVVAEWTSGRSLREVAETEPSPVGAARAVKALAGAAEAAHRSGTALAVDHPDRVRISTTGNAVLAFPAVTSGATQRTDVAGLGAVLYALLTNRWPLRRTEEPGSHTVGGMALAPREADGVVAAPRSLRASVPFELSAVTVRALQPASGIRTAAAVQTVLEQASVLDQQTDTFPAIRDDEPYAPPQRYEGDDAHGGPLPYDGADEEATPSLRKERRSRSRKLIVSLVVLLVVIVGLLAFIGKEFSGLFSTDATTPLPSLSQPSSGAASSPAAPAGAAPVKATDTVVYSPGGDLDSADSVGNTTDGNVATSWSSDTYLQPFPGLKPGLGVLVTLTQATKLTQVGIDSPSPGTVVEIRSASSASPTLASTTVLATATLGNGRTDVPVNTADPTKYVIVWMTTLGKKGSGNVSTLAELTFTGTP